eukprot:gene2218-4307_t
MSRNVEWIINVMWSASSRFSINTPATFLFHNGYPSKAIISDQSTGSIKRIALQESEGSSKGENLDGIKNLKILRRLLIENEHYHNGSQDNNDESLLCTVWYTDGEMESLTLRSFDILMRNDSWRLQLSVCQTYIHSYDDKIGEYSSTIKVRSKLQSEGYEAIDQLTKALAKGAEQSYSSLNNGSSKESGMKIIDLKALFVLDSRSNIVFLYSKHLIVEATGANKAVDDYLTDEKDARETTAARALTNELLQLLHHAKRRGLSAEDSFAHFDISRCGFIDTGMLMDGLARLGVGATYSVTQLMMQLIGGLGCNFLTMNDFENFINSINDDDTMKSFPLSSSASASGSAFPFQRDTSPSKSKRTPQLKTPITTDVTSSSSSRPLTTTSRIRTSNTNTSESRTRTRSRSLSRNGNGNGNGSRSGRQLPPLSSVSMISSSSSNGNKQYDDSFPFGNKSNHINGNVNANVNASVNANVNGEDGDGDGEDGNDFALELPLSPSSYRVPPLSEQDRNSGSSAASSLPPWARQRHRRALKELQHAQEKKNAVAKTASKGNSRGGVSGSIHRHTGHTTVAPSHPHHVASEPSVIDNHHHDGDEDENPTMGEGEGGEDGLSETSSIAPTMSSESSLVLTPRIPRNSNSVGNGSGGNVLNLEGITQELHADLKTSQDELLHVEGGVVMTYRVILGPRCVSSSGNSGDSNVTGTTKSFQNDVLRYKEGLQQRLEKLNLPDNESYAEDGQGESEPEPVPGHADAFTVIIVPDLFSTLETIKVLFEPLLTRYPSSRLVLMGLPGLPNTHWARGCTLDPDLSMRSICALLIHLRDKNRLISKIGDPIFFMGVGSGAYTLVRFISRCLPGMTWFERMLSTVILINGFVKITKSLRRVYKDLYEAMQSAGTYEMNDIIASLHFWDGYLTQRGRDNALSQFWHSRRGMCNEKLEGGRSYIGVLEQLRGLIMSDKSSTDEDGRTLLETPFPLVVIQSTEDVFVDPRHVTAFQFQSDTKNNKYYPPGRVAVEDLEACSRAGTIHISWLKAGHEVLQERTPYILALMSTLAQNCGIRPTAATSEDDNGNSGDGMMEGDGDGDIETLARRRKERIQADKDAKQRALEAEKSAALEFEIQAQLQREQELERQRVVEEEQKRMQAAEDLAQLQLEYKVKNEQEFAQKKRLEDAEMEEERRKLERKRKEKERRVELQQARRKREDQNETNRQLQAMYEMDRQDKLRLAEGRERERMRREDELSMYAEEYNRDCEDSIITAESARLKMKELFQARREEATRRVEEHMARERAERLEARRRAAVAIVEQIENEQLNLEGLKAGGYDAEQGYDVALQTIAATHRLVKDLFECQERSVDAWKRLELMKEKTEMFRSQCDSIQNETRRLRRAIRLIETTPALRELGASEAELEELRRTLDHKEEMCQELLSLRKTREAQLSAANRCCIRLKNATKERDDLLIIRLKELEVMERHLAQESRDFRHQKELYMGKKDMMASKANLIRKRIKILADERKRVKDIHEEYIDSDVWVEGVLQRCKSKDLKKYLKTEHHQEKDKLLAMENEIAALLEKIVSIGEKQLKLERDCNKIGSALKSFQRVLSKVNINATSDVAKNMLTRQNKADLLEAKKRDELETDKKAARLGAVLLADKIRVKDSELRSLDEKKFLGMDLIRNPDLYTHLTSSQMEEMHFDVNYHCNLSNADIQRIEQLPEQVALALPFLYTKEEIDIHRLINKFLRYKDDEYFRKKDAKSAGRWKVEVQGQDQDGADAEESDDVEGVSNEDMSQAEVIHDILVKQSRRDRVRTLANDEDITEEERSWLLLDRILSPHAFDDTEEFQPAKLYRKKDCDTLLYSSVISPPPTTTTTGKVKKNTMKSPLKTTDIQKANTPDRVTAIIDDELMVDGDRYMPLRDAYNNSNDNDNEEDLFTTQEWECPFTQKELLELRNYPNNKSSSSSSNEIDMERLQSIKKGKGKVEVEDALLCIELMKKYYVSEDESILGHKRLHILQELSKDITRVMSISEGDADGINGAGVGATSLNGDSISNASSLSVDSKYFKRVWGSWEQVHPASAGFNSQSHTFISSSYNASRDHPASFAVLERDNDDGRDHGDNEDEDDMEITIPSATQLRAQGAKALTALPVDPTVDTLHIRNDPLSKWYIARNIRELSLQNPSKVGNKMTVIVNEGTMNLLDISDSSLQTRQSRSLRFEVPHREDLCILDITVSVVFQGVFGTRGYKLGRLAGGLFRLPDEKDKATSLLPRSVGYAPYPLQTPNLPDSMGRIVLIHRPKKVPIQPGAFQIVLGAASSVKFSVQVSCKYAEAALPIVDRLILQAKEMQGRMPICLRELQELQESVRLAERKLLVCDKMIAEADVESQRCRKNMEQLNDKLEKDDQTMEMLEDERREVQRELTILEVEFAQWATVFSSRCQEKLDIKEGITMMYNFQRERQKEKNELKTVLEEARRDLPSCIAVLRSLVEASNIAASLNTSVAGPSGKKSLLAPNSNNNGSIPRLVTPAENIRKQHMAEGWLSLNIEEQQWSLLDQALRPELYDWLREKEEEEDLARHEKGKKPKKRKFNVAVEPYRHAKAEVESILNQPFSMLNRHDMLVRKLLSKYHDNQEMMRSKFAQAAYGFDPHLAERIRAKNVKTRSREEREWVSLDKILHPEIWAYYQHDADVIVEQKRNEDAARLLAITDNEGNNGDVFNPGGISAVSQLDTPDDDDGGSATVNSVTSASKSKSTRATAAGAIANLTAGKRGHGQQQQMLDRVGHLLGMKEEMNKTANSQTGSVNLSKVVDAAQTVLLTRNADWKCPFDREALIKIWRTPKHQLPSDQERIAYQLLQKYNGTYGSYVEAKESRRKRSKNEAQTGKHVKWDAFGNVAEIDVDERARSVLRALDQAVANKNPHMDSTIIHGNQQRFPTTILRIELEEELDNILREQITERERALRRHVNIADSSDSESDLSQVSETLSHEDGDEGDEEGNGTQKNMKDDISTKIKKRSMRRDKRRLKLKKDSQEAQVMKARKLVQTKNKTGEALKMANLQNQLGVNACLACRSNPCKWKPFIDTVSLQARRKVLDAEVDRVRSNPGLMTFESVVALGAQQGGNIKYRREDLLDELVYERNELERRFQLNDVDKELHDCYHSRKEYIEVKHLHGYATILWTNNARRALEARCRKLIAMNVAQEVVDDILDWMLEGWYFGERESSYSVLGYVPSIKKDGVVKSGQDQISTVSIVTSKMRSRMDLKKAGIMAEETQKGTVKEKSLPIEAESQYRLREDKVAKEGTRHAHILNETESTLRIGLFMLTIMYFRAMAFVGREKRTWGEDSESSSNNSKSKTMTDERRRMIEEENKVEIRRKKMELVLGLAKTGDQRRQARELAERREATLRLQAVVRRQQLEKESTTHIQRVFRGHLGRKVAKRWALKRAELSAMNALLHAAATSIQRYFRGYLGRVETLETRKEMAHFIALMRAQEAAEDEIDYWQTHPLAKFKRNAIEGIKRGLKMQDNKTPLGGPSIPQEERPHEWDDDDFDEEEAEQEKQNNLPMPMSR